MADDVDNAQEKIELGLADAIRHARSPAFRIVATGRCLYCDEVLGDELRWCDASCRDAWQKLTGVK